MNETLNDASRHRLEVIRDLRQQIAFLERQLDVARDAVEAALSARALVAGARCYRRPDSKLEPDPGPCGKCAACLARDAFYDQDGSPAPWTKAVVL